MTLAHEITTTEEALAAWDRGDTVWSAEMGGLGPGYEQCIQITAFEMLRYMAEHPFDYAALDELDDDDRKRAMSRAYDDAMSKVLFADGHSVNELGLSGAQYGAASNMAHRFMRVGYRAALDELPTDRRILVCRTFPQSGEQAA